MNPATIERTVKAASAIATVIGVYLASFLLAGATPAPQDSFQEPQIPTGGVDSQAWLRAAPPPSPQEYGGVGSPTLVVTHASSTGGLHAVLHEAVIWSSEGGGGVDLCGKTRIILDDFRVFYPMGGASPSDANVTYSSNAYEQPSSNLPGNDECGLRAAPGRTWNWRACFEFDGSLDEPQPTAAGTVFDRWDGCIEGTSAPSSTLPELL